MNRRPCWHGSEQFSKTCTNPFFVYAGPAEPCKFLNSKVCKIFISSWSEVGHNISWIRIYSYAASCKHLNRGSFRIVCVVKAWSKLRVIQMLIPAKMCTDSCELYCNRICTVPYTRLAQVKISSVQKFVRSRVSDYIRFLIYFFTTWIIFFYCPVSAPFAGDHKLHLRSLLNSPTFTLFFHSYSTTPSFCHVIIRLWRLLLMLLCTALMTSWFAFSITVSSTENFSL